MPEALRNTSLRLVAAWSSITWRVMVGEIVGVSRLGWLSLNRVEKVSALYSPGGWPMTVTPATTWEPAV